VNEFKKKIPDLTTVEYTKKVFEAKSIDKAKESILDYSEAGVDSWPSTSSISSSSTSKLSGNPWSYVNLSAQSYYAPEPHHHSQLYNLTPPITAGRAAGTCKVCDTYHNKLWWDGSKIISECCGERNFVDILVEDNEE
jgi:hypothetical protein